MRSDRKSALHELPLAGCCMFWRPARCR